MIRGEPSLSWIKMTAYHDIPELDAKGLRRFALIMSVIVAVLFGLGLPALLEFSPPLWPWFVAGVLTLLGLLAPQRLSVVYRGWITFGLIMNRLTTPLVLGIVFFLVITPTALLMRLIHRDTMARARDSRSGSYRIHSRKAPREKMERPY